MTTATRNIFDDLGVTPQPQPQSRAKDLTEREISIITKDSSAPADLRLRAQALKLPYKDERINDPSIREWMEERRLGVGASEIAVLFGVSPWSTIREMWHEKVHGCSYEPGSEIFHWGHTMEPVIAAEFARRYNVEVGDPPSMIMIGDKPHYRASLDRVVIEDGEPIAAVELKNLNESRHAEYRVAGPSIGYLLQLQYQLMVAGLDHGYLAVLFGGQKFGAWRVLASPSMQREIARRVDEFWNYVETKTEPPETLGSREVQISDDHVLRLEDPEWEARMSELDDLRVKKSKIDKSEKALKAQVKEVLGEYQTAEAGQMMASVSVSTRRSLDTSRLKEDHPELIEEYTKEAEVRAIRIRRKSQ